MMQIEAQKILYLQKRTCDYKSGLNTSEMSRIVNCFLPKIYCNQQGVEGQASERMILGDLARERQCGSQGLDYDILCTGSFYDGLSMPKFYRRCGSHAICSVPDQDIMLVQRYMPVVTEKRAPALQCPLVIHTQEDTHPGFLRIKIVNELIRENGQCSFAIKALMSDSEPLYLSSFKAQASLLQSTQTVRKYPSDDVMVHGPAAMISDKRKMSDVKGRYRRSADMVSAFPCPIWPSEAKEWITRCRNWPSVKVVHAIVLQGCHVVPVAHSKSNARDLEWRFSFSNAEKFLARCLNSTQRQCFLVLKSLLCHSNIISSYLLKTTLFWVCENVPHKFWNSETILARIINVLETLLYFLTRHNLPNYFMPENNMIDHLERWTVLYLAKQILSIRMAPIEAILAFNDKYVYATTPQLMPLRDIFMNMILNMQNKGRLVPFHTPGSVEAAKLIIVEFFKENRLALCWEAMVAIVGRIGTSNSFMVQAIEEKCTTDNRIDSVKSLLAEYEQYYDVSVKSDYKGHLVFLQWVKYLETCQSQASLLSLAEISVFEKSFQNALDIYPENIQTRLYFANFLVSCDKQEIAIPLLHTIYQSDSSLATKLIFTSLDKIFFDSHIQAWLSYQKQIAIIAKVLALYLVVVALKRMNKPNEAIHFIPQLLDVCERTKLVLKRGYWQSYIIAGLCFVELGETILAKKVFDKVLKLYPQHDFVKKLNDSLEIQTDY